MGAREGSRVPVFEVRRERVLLAYKPIVILMAQACPVQSLAPFVVTAK